VVPCVKLSMNKLTRSISVGDQIFTLSIFLKSAVFIHVAGQYIKHYPDVVQRLSGLAHDWQLFVTLGGKSLHIIQALSSHACGVIYRYCSDARCVVPMLCVKFYWAKKKTGGG